MLDISKSISLITIGISIVFLIYFSVLNRKFRGYSNYLIVSIIIVQIIFVFEYIVLLDKTSAIVVFLPIYYALYLSFYPALYLYNLRLSVSQEEFNKERKFKYFALPILILVIVSAYLYPLNFEQKIEFMNITFYGMLDGDYDSGANLIVYSSLALYYIQFIYIILKMISLIKKLNIRTDQNSKTPLNFFPKVLTLFVISFISFELILVSTTIVFPEYLFNFMSLIVSMILILFIGYLGINQSLFLLQNKFSNFEMDENKKYSILEFDESEKEKIKDLAYHVIVSQKVYRNPNLKLDTLAKKIHVSSQKLSIVINELFGMNFTRFINQHRIEDAKKMIKNGEEKSSYEQIGFAVGFNSKATFFRVFKESTGLTPNEYKSKLYRKTA